MSTGEFHAIGGNGIPLDLNGEQIYLTPDNTTLKLYEDGNLQYNHCRVVLGDDDILCFLPDDELMRDMEDFGIEIVLESEPDETAVSFLEGFVQAQMDDLDEDLSDLI